MNGFNLSLEERVGDELPGLRSRLGAEFLGTFWLVFGGCGTAVLAAGFAAGAVGLLGVALAFGLSVLTMAYAVAHISGAHFNPAVSVGLAVAGRFKWREVPAYAVAQLLGGIAAGSLLFVVAHGRPGFDATRSGFAANGYGAHSPGGYGLLAAAVVETVLTAFFVFVILGSTDGRAPDGFAPIAIGLTLTMIHLISIPIDNTSVNPARSTSVALFAGAWAMGQLWLFWLTPLFGAIVAGAAYAIITDERGKTLIDGGESKGERQVVNVDRDISSV